MQRGWTGKMFHTHFIYFHNLPAEHHDCSSVNHKIKCKHVSAMKYQLVTITILIFQTVNSDDLDMLNQIYRDFSNIYYHYIHKRSHNIDPSEWRDWIQPNEIPIRDPISESYDFIIVGSGSAGSVLANRLTEVPHWRVLLLEAGRGENRFSRVPLAAPTLQFTEYNWGYLAEYQPNMCLGLVNHRMHWPRGRALGGTSVINYMIYTRGNRRDYDRWRNQGNPGWSYDEIFPYYIKSEDSKLRNSDYRFHGVGGYLSTEDIYQSQLVKTFVEAGNELGLPTIDYNANIHSFGVSTVQATVLHGRRHSNAAAFLHPVRHRPNLHILTSAFVTKILINPNTKTAYGVEYERFGKKFRVGADKEVILSAGTFLSPQLLMLAGIGPREHLQELGIPILQDLPVGYNLQDHLTFVGLSFLINQDISISANQLLDPAIIKEYLHNGTGPYTSLGGVEGIGYIKTELSRDPEDVPDIELIFIGASLSTDYGIFTRRGMNIRDDIYDGLFRPNHNIPNWTIFPMLLHPKSRGYLRLRNRDPHVYPLLYGNYFTDPEEQDINTLVASIRFIQKLAKTRAFQRYESRLNPNHMPGCELYQFDSDDYWKCALRFLSVTLHHQVGTVKMGPPEDPNSVVNHELKVYGIRRLRVADSSVIPFVIGAHINAPATMIGEKASDIIKENWGELEYRSKFLL